MFGMFDENLFLLKPRHANFNSDPGSYCYFKDLQMLIEDALQLNGYLEPLKAVLEAKHPGKIQGDVNRAITEEESHVRYDRLFDAINDSMMINMVPRFQNLTETATNLMLLKTVAYFMFQKPCRMDGSAIRKGINAYRLTCSGNPSKDRIFYEEKCKNLNLDADVLHRALKLAGVTIGTN